MVTASAVGMLILKLLGLALLYFGVKWLVDYLGINVPDMVMKIFAAACVIGGAMLIAMFFGW
jgi:hypothetical protein